MEVKGRRLQTQKKYRERDWRREMEGDGDITRGYKNVTVKLKPITLSICTNKKLSYILSFALSLTHACMCLHVCTHLCMGCPRRLDGCHVSWNWSHQQVVVSYRMWGLGTRIWLPHEHCMILTLSHLSSPKAGSFLNFIFLFLHPN